VRFIEPSKRRDHCGFEVTGLRPIENCFEIGGVRRQHPRSILKRWSSSFSLFGELSCFQTKAKA